MLQYVNNICGMQQQNNTECHAVVFSIGLNKKGSGHSSDADVATVNSVPRTEERTGHWW